MKINYFGLFLGLFVGAVIGNGIAYIIAYVIVREAVWIESICQAFGLAIFGYLGAYKLPK